jgi:bifunctional polynucleotide phosphatase/kinase
MNDGVQPDVAESFFVGDAAGRDWDIGDAAESDKKFAEDIGLKFMLPEDLFGVKENKAMGYAFLELSKVIADSGIDNAVFKARSTKLTGETVLRFPEVITTSKQLNGIKGVGAKSKQKVDEYLKDGRLSEMDELKGGVKHDVPIGKEAEVAMKFL